MTHVFYIFRSSRNIVAPIFASFLRRSSMLTHNDLLISLTIQVFSFAFLDR